MAGGLPIRYRKVTRACRTDVQVYIGPLAAVAEGPYVGITCCDALARATCGRRKPTGDRQMG